MSVPNGDVGLVDRLTRSVGIRLSRRAVLRSSLWGAVGLAGLTALTPVEAAACSGCHYCVSGCTSCQSHWFVCCSGDNSTCNYCAGPCGVGVCPCQRFYLKNYVCNGGCDFWCDWASC
jgi:hypothetical protein